MNKLELLKSQTIQFEIEMNKFRLSEDVLNDMAKKGIDVQNIEILNIDIDSKEQLKQLKTFLKEHKNMLKTGLYDYCMEEYREIKDDYKFRNTKDGKLIIEIEKWVKKMRKKLPEFENQKLFIGRSYDDPKKLIIGGIINNETEKEKFMNFFEQFNPPVTPEYIFEKE